MTTITSAQLYEGHFTDASIATAFADEIGVDLQSPPETLLLQIGGREEPLLFKRRKHSSYKHENLTINIL